MKIVLFGPKYFEKIHGRSKGVVNYFKFVMEAFESKEISPIFHSIEVLFFIAPESEFVSGKFKEFQEFNWEYGIATIAVRGNYERYLNGNEKEKVAIIHSMLLDAVARLKEKRKAKFDVPQMEVLINMAYQKYIEETEDSGDTGDGQGAIRDH